MENINRELPHKVTPELKRAESQLREFLENWLLDLASQKFASKLIISSQNIQNTKTYHQLYQAYLVEAVSDYASQIKCTSGCGNCCQHYPLSIEPFELVRIYQSIRQRPDFAEIIEDCYKRTRVYFKLRAKYLSEPDTLANGELEACEEEILHQYFFKNLKCPLDRNGDCSEYSNRPSTCRMYYSLSEPRYCVPEHLLKPENKNFIVYLPDDIEETLSGISAWYEPLQLPESLYEGILRLNELEGIFDFDRSQS
jgi:Fe-S-cluster containining protein